MRKEIIVGDMHIKKEEPFFSASMEIMDQILKMANSGDQVIFEGDVFHTSKPYPQEYHAFIEKILSRKDIDFFILQGNHDYNGTWNSFSTLPLENLENVTIISEPCTLTILDRVQAFLPWLPNSYLKSRENIKFKTMKEFYEKEFLNQIEGEAVQAIHYHFDDETSFMGIYEEGINLSIYEDKLPIIKRLGGHIHLQSKNYIGTPYPTRYDERGQVGRVYTRDYDSNEYKEVYLREVLKYIDLDYEDNLDTEEDMNYILTIKNAPSVKDAFTKFKRNNTIIRDTSITVKEESELDGIEADENKSIKEYLDQYCITNKVDSKTKSYLFSLF
jgi:DNA repair exonuclease SbcCD nuclease subunit